MKKLMEFFEDRGKLADFVKSNRDMVIKVAVAAVAVIAAFFVFAPGQDDAKAANPQIETDDVVTASEETAASVYVDIGGEVVNPMVAELDEGCRVQDAIEAAGGLTENADISQINRAAFIEDGDKIFIPSLEPAEGDAIGALGSEGYSDGKVNINTADSAELQELEGVGPATADKIISYREENGRFRNIEDIKNVSGIGDKTFEKFRDKIKT